MSRLRKLSRWLNVVGVARRVKALKDWLCAQLGHLSARQEVAHTETQQNHAAMMQALIRVIETQATQMQQLTEQHTQVVRRLNQLAVKFDELAATQRARPAA